MKMKQNNILPIVCFFLCLLLLGICLHIKNTMEPYEIIRTDTITNTDTIINTDTFTYFKEKPVPVYRTITKTDTLYTEKGDTVLVTENKTYIDTVCAKKDTAIVTSYITGINAHQDSLRVEMRTTKETITNTIEVTKYIKDNRRFNWGIQGGIGYGFTSKQIEPFLGIGIQINI